MWTRLPFEAAAANFDTACRYGIEARLQWPRRGRRGGITEVDAVDLVRDELLPLAHAGLEAWGVEPADRDLYLGVIEQRCRLRANGASWQAATFHRAVEQGLDRQAALAATTRRYRALMHVGEPVHTWPVGLPEPVPLGERTVGRRVRARLGRRSDGSRTGPWWDTAAVFPSRRSRDPPRREPRRPPRAPRCPGHRCACSDDAERPTDRRYPATRAPAETGPRRARMTERRRPDPAFGVRSRSTPLAHDLHSYPGDPCRVKMGRGGIARREAGVQVEAGAVADTSMVERPTRRILRDETLLVLALSLGASGVSALISFVGSVTKPGGSRSRRPLSTPRRRRDAHGSTWPGSCSGSRPRWCRWCSSPTS